MAMKFYTADDCRRKADQHWEMAGLARQDNDHPAATNHLRLAQLWTQRMNEGGYADDPA